MGARKCNDDLGEVLKDLASAVREQTEVLEGELDWFRSQTNCVTLEQLQTELEKLEEIIMATQAEAAAQIRASTDEIKNAIATDIDLWLEKISALEDALPDVVIPELQTAIDDLKSTVTAVDEKYPKQTADTVRASKK